jgi:hypothetical protein
MSSMRARPAAERWGVRIAFLRDGRRPGPFPHIAGR